MSLLTQKKFSFTSKAIAKDTFTVVSFKGFEAISKPYEFEITLISKSTNIDPLEILQNPATFTIHRDKEKDVDFNGILMQFEETQEFNGYLFFKAVLTPKLWWLSLTHHNQVFLDMTIPEIMEAALKDGELATGIDFEFRLQNDYQPFEYICQYDESHFNFVSRWAEREGIYYFFEQTPKGEKVVFTDTKISHLDLLPGKNLVYHPQSGLDSLHTKEVIKNFLCKHNMLPQRVYLKDYNYLKPSLAMEGMADVDSDGRGENYIYGEHFATPEEGNRLAGIRAEELLCRKSVFYGKSSVPFMVPGFTFDLKDHYKDIYNRKYLISDVVHEGHQTGFLISGLSSAVEPREEQMFYANTFTAIYSDVQFRPERAAEKAKIAGTLHAKIDAATSGQYAELDELGRYKVILPFDRSGRHGGKASAWFRMMQPYAGPNQGMHFPLHKGTEVVLTFMDGDPDRPLIAGAVPNPETASPVTAGNQTKSIITTGRNPVNLSAGAATQTTGSTTSRYIEFEDVINYERILIHSDEDIWTEAQGRYAEYTIGGPTALDEDTGTTEVEGDVPSELHYLWKKFYGSGSNQAFKPTGMKKYSYPTDEKKSNYTGSTLPSSSDCATMKKLAKKGKVLLAKGDTFNTQDGNIYDFGGYWNYNLGNCYVEEHLNQKAELNQRSDVDLLNTGGPKWSSVEWDRTSGLCDSIKDLTEEDIKIGPDTDDGDDLSFESDKGVWVTKQFGNSYSLTEGHSIDISKGDTLDIEYGGSHVEMVIRGNGKIKSWSRRGDIVNDAYDPDADANDTDKDDEQYEGGKEERKWNGLGELRYKNKLTYLGNRGYHTVTHSWDEKKANTFNYSASATSSFDFDAKTSFALSIGACAALSVGVAASVDIKFSAGAGFKMDLGASAFLALKGHLGGDYTINLVTLEVEAKLMGMKAQKEAALKAKVESLVLKQTAMALGSTPLKLKDEAICMRGGKAYIRGHTLNLFA